MPTPIEYAEAIEECTLMSNVCVDQSAMLLALRWLRVGAAMEAGTLSVSCGRDGKWDAAFMHGTGFQNVFAAPDPLTAAERAMGVEHGVR